MEERTRTESITEPRHEFEEVELNTKNEANLQQDILNDVAVSENPPDGKYAWFIVFCAFFVQFVALGVLYSFGMFLIPLSEEFDIGRGTVSWIGSVSIGAMMLFALISGVMADLFGFRITVGIGGVLISIGLLVSSFMKSVWALFATYGLCVGFGICFSYVPILGCVGQWFVKHRSFATGIAVAGAGIGNLAIPPLGTKLIEDYGWRNTMRILSAFPIIVIIASLSLKSRIPKRSVKIDYRELIYNRAMILFISSSLFAAFGYIVPFVHIISYARDVGIDNVRSSLLLAFMGGSSTIGRIVLGKISDKYGRVMSLKLTFGAMTLITAFWTIIKIFPILVVWSILYGFFGGGFVSQFPPLVVDYFGIQRLSKALGIIYIGAGIGTLIGPPIIGIIYDKTGSYLIGIIVTSISLFLSFLLLVFLPKTPTGSKVAPPIDKLKKMEEQ